MSIRQKLQSIFGAFNVTAILLPAYRYNIEDYAPRRSWLHLGNVDGDDTLSAAAADRR
jgi:hypothetical protein